MPAPAAGAAALPSCCSGGAGFTSANVCAGTGAASGESGCTAIDTSARQPASRALNNAAAPAAMIRFLFKSLLQYDPCLAVASTLWRLACHRHDQHQCRAGRQRVAPMGSAHCSRVLRARQMACSRRMPADLQPAVYCCIVRWAPAASHRSSASAWAAIAAAPPASRSPGSSPSTRPSRSDPVRRPDRRRHTSRSRRDRRARQRV